MADANFDRDHVSTSKFYMIRCLVAMAHADDDVAAEEEAYIEHFIAKLPMTDEQTATLRQDLKHPVPAQELLPHINEPKFRGQLVYFARLMAYKDGILHPKEEELLHYFYHSAVDGLDMEQIRKDVAAYVQKEMAEHTKYIESIRPDAGMFWAVDQALLSVGVDVMDD